MREELWDARPPDDIAVEGFLVLQPSRRYVRVVPVLLRDRIKPQLFGSFYSRLKQKSKRLFRAEMIGDLA